MHNINRFITIAFLISILIAGCGKAGKSDEEPTRRYRKIGLALGYAGIGDMAFNDMQYRGLIQAKHEYPIDVVYKVPTTETIGEQERCIQDLIDEGCELIFSSGIFSVEGLKRYAPMYPQIHFVLLDNPLSGFDNVSSAIYSQHEGSFLVGFLASKFSRTGKVGFIGGVDIPVIKAFLQGFKEGIQYADPKVTLTAKYCSEAPDFNGFNDPDKGYKLATEMYDQGIDVIYNVASASGNGIITAAKDRGKYVIGVDSNQDALAKGYVLTSMMKRIDLSISDLVGKFIKGELKGNTIYTYGLGNDGIQLTDMKYTRDFIGEKLIIEVYNVRQKIIDGKIKVTNIHEQYLKEYLDEQGSKAEE